MLLIGKPVNHLFLRAIYTMAMLNNQRVYIYIWWVNGMVSSFQFLTSTSRFLDSSGFFRWRRKFPGYAPNAPVTPNHSIDVPQKNGKTGMLGHPSVHCGCYGFYVVVQCFILTFDVLCGGGSGAIFLLSVHRFLFHYFVKSIVDVLS